MQRAAPSTAPAGSSASRDQRVACPGCGRRVPRRSRQQRYCSDRCRKQAFEQRRERKPNRALKNGGRYPYSGNPTNPHKNTSAINGYAAAKWRSTPAIYAPRRVLAREIIDGRTWRPVVSSSGVACEVTRLRARGLIEH
jgi:hypothetical protein